jgi:hypothetical protein
MDDIPKKKAIAIFKPFIKFFKIRRLRKSVVTRIIQKNMPCIKKTPE